MTKPNYNDGLWHGWNGGECPVHPRTKLDAVFSRTGTSCDIAAADLDWNHGFNPVPIIAFRVTKEYKEPREWSLYIDPTGFNRMVFDSHAAAIGAWEFARDGKVIRVREVIEGDDG